MKVRVGIKKGYLIMSSSFNDSGFASMTDNLVSRGILNGDANAFVKGTAPRYGGNPFPKEYMPLDQPVLTPMTPGFGYPTGGMYLSGQPSSDAFVYNNNPNKSTERTLPWIKMILGAGLLATASLIGLDALKKHLDGKKSKDASGVAKDVPKIPEEKPSNLNKVKDGVSTAFEKAKGGASTVFNKLKGLKLRWKVAGGIGLGLLALVGLSKLRSHHSQNNQV